MAAEDAAVFFGNDYLAEAFGVVHGHGLSVGAEHGLKALDGQPLLLRFFFGYFAIPYAMQYLRATTVSVYTNLQPVVASLVAIAIGQDILTWDKPVAAVLVLLGAWFVTKE